MYADALVLISDNEDNLQTMLNFFYDWCNKWQMNCNAAKTQVVHFRKPCMRRTSMIYLVGSKALEIVKQYK